MWDKDARFIHLNVTDVVKNELGKAQFEHLILASPTVDISNIDTSKVKPEDSTETFKHKVQISCQNILRVAGLKKVTIMNHAPRFDAHKVDPVGIKPKLASCANSFMLELWLNSPNKNRIVIGSYNLECLLIQERKDTQTNTLAVMMGFTCMEQLAK